MPSADISVAEGFFQTSAILFPVSESQAYTVIPATY